MTTQIAVIDPYMIGPANQCFNSLVNLLGVPATYHMPAQWGFGSLEKTMGKTHAYIILGSASNLCEELPWHLPLGELVKAELEKGKPVLGCCFGHQLMCHMYGAEVDFDLPDQSKHLGRRTVTVTEDFWNFRAGETFELAVTHRQVVKKLSPELIEVGHGLPHDLVIHRSLPFLGSQPHPESSRYFCENDVKEISATDIELVLSGGSQLISRFFQHFKLV